MELTCPLTIVVSPYFLVLGKLLMCHQDGANLSSHNSCLASFPCVREAINASSGWSVPVLPR